MSFSQKVSQTPSKLSVAVPETTKSNGSVMHPIVSELAINGLPSSSIPAIVVSTKYGVNLKRRVDWMGYNCKKPFGI